MRILLLLLTGISLSLPAAAATGLVVEVRPELVPAEHHEDSYYLWPFEVRVTNHADVPVRIVEFGSQNLRTGHWVDPGRWFGSQEFTDWYTDGDTVEDGWIQPGQTAIDARSWNRFYAPMPERSRWVYRAEDGAGTGHEVTVEPEFVPHSSGRQNWQERGVSLVTGIAIRLDGSDLPALASARVRFGRYPGGTQAFAEYRGREVDAVVPVPGTYWLDVWAPGHERVSVPLVLSGMPLSGSIRIEMRERGDPTDPALEFTGLGRDAADAVEFYRAWAPAQYAYFEARNAYREEYGSPDGFEYEPPELAQQLGEWIDDDSRPNLARFATLLSLDSPFSEPRPTGDRIFELLPFDSWHWGFGPHMAGNATSRAADRSEAIRRFAQESPVREVRANMLQSMGYAAKSERDREELTRIVELLRSEYADVAHMKVILEDLERAEKYVVGEPAPEFAVPTLEGDGEVTSAALRGRYYLLHFWATWCAPCMVEMGHLHEVHEEFAGDELEFVSISMDHRREAVERMRQKQWPMPWTNIHAEDIEDFDDRFGISAIPALFLIDPDGIVVAGSQELRDALDATLAEHLGED